MSDFLTPGQWQQYQDHARHQEHRITILKAKVERLTAERDALAAQVHQIRDVLRLYVETPRSHMSQTDALGGVEAALRGES